MTRTRPNTHQRAGEDRRKKSAATMGPLRCRYYSDLEIRWTERATRMEPAFSAWESLRAETRTCTSAAIRAAQPLFLAIHECPFETEIYPSYAPVRARIAHERLVDIPNGSRGFESHNLVVVPPKANRCRSLDSLSTWENASWPFPPAGTRWSQLSRRWPSAGQSESSPWRRSTTRWSPVVPSGPGRRSRRPCCG